MSAASRDTARVAQSARDSLLERHQPAIDSLNEIIAVAGDSARAAKARARLAEASAAEIAPRIRAQLTVELQAEFDVLEDYHAEALAEERRAWGSLALQLATAERKFATEHALRLVESNRADRWREAYESEAKVVQELERPTIRILGIGITLRCTGGIGASAGAGGAAGGASVACGPTIG